VERNLEAAFAGRDLGGGDVSLEEQLNGGSRINTRIH
jgi:hypothetical protein